MFGMKADRIDTLQNRANGSITFIDEFAELVQLAQTEAEALSADASEEISKLKSVQSKCNRVEKFTKNLLKVVG